VLAILPRSRFSRAIVTNFFFMGSLNGFVLLPLYIHAIGGSEVEIGLVMSLYSAMGIVCQPLFGPWIDAVGRRPFMFFGVALVLMSSLLAVFVRSVPWLGVVRALQGIGFSAFFVATFSYAIDLVPPARRGWALGLFGVSGLASSALTPLFGEWVIRRFGFRPLFAVCALFAAVAGALAWSLHERPRGGDLALPDAEWARAAAQCCFQRHMAVTAFFGLGTGTIFAFLPTFAESLGVTTLALFYTAYAGSAMAVRVFGGQLIDTRGRRAVIVPSMFVQVSAVALLATVGLFAPRMADVPVLPVLFLAGLMAGGGHGFLYPGLAALVTDQVRPAQRGAVVGVFSAVFLLGSAGGAFSFGYVAHAVGYGLMWTFLAALLLGGAVVSWGLEEQVVPLRAVQPD
jgi:MFS family permease